MASPLDPATTAALTDAIRELERCSCAEVVVEIRARSGSYAHADARCASLVAFLALLVLLFSPWHFSAMWVAVDVAIAWMAGSFLARKSDAVRRLFATRNEQLAAARTFAAAAFHDRGVANTREETGVLIYLSLLERHVEVLADRGILAAVPALEWNRVVSQHQDATPESVVELVRELTPLLGGCLPVREGDVDELCDVPRFTEE